MKSTVVQNARRRLTGTNKTIYTVRLFRAQRGSNILKLLDLFRASTF